MRLKRGLSFIMIMAMTMAGVIAVGGSEVGAAAQRPADFYRGKRIDFIIPNAPGDTSDLIARVVVKYLDKYAGTTSVIRNVREAGGAQGLNELYRAKPDGLTLGQTNTVRSTLAEIMEQPGVEYQTAKLSWIANITEDFMTFSVAPKSPFKTIADLKAGKNLILAASGGVGHSTLTCLALIEALDLDAKVIIYKSSGERSLAVAQGEVQGFFGSTSASLKGAQRGQSRLLFVLATKRSPVIPDVPTLRELITLPKEKAALMKLWEEDIFVMNSLFGTPGIPKDRLNYLREVAAKITNDPEFKMTMEKVSDSPLSVMNGSELEKQFGSLLGRKAAIKQIYQRLQDKYLK